MFNLVKIENGRMNVPEPEYFDAKASTEIQVGQALALQNGVLAPVGGTTKPEFISLAKLPTSAAKREIPVARVNDEQVYEVSVTAAPTSLKVGSKVTISSDGTEVTATTTDGVATIVNLKGAAAEGDKILVKFV